MPDSIQSHEPADIETPFRRAYFTNYGRQEVVDWYTSEFNKPTIFNIKFSSIRLNYGPEEAGTIIRDQTRSTFLEEVAHPLRESIYINGFEPKDPKDEIFIENRHWKQKIIVRHVQSSALARLLVFAGLVVSTILIEQAVTGLVKKGKK